jgi:sigma-E factor negative regulatory protein RseC
VIESPARIRRVEGETAWVVSEAPSSCAACAGKGCGSSVFARFWHPDEAEYPVTNPIDAQPGDAVVIGLPDGAVLYAALTSYGIPLLMLLIGSAIGSYFFGELAAIGCGLSGLALSAIWLRTKVVPDQSPVILRLGEVSSCQKP